MMPNTKDEYRSPPAIDSSAGDIRASGFRTISRRKMDTYMERCMELHLVNVNNDFRMSRLDTERL